MTTNFGTDTRTELDDCDVDDWTGTDGLDTSAPDPVESTGSLGLVVSTETQEAYDAVTSDDWSAGGTFFIWGRAYGAMDTLQNGGIQAVIGDGTDRNGYHVGGSDVTGFRHFEGPVEWACFVVDPGNLPQYVTNFAGTEANLTLTAVTQIGIAFKTLAKSVGGSRNCHVDIPRWADIGDYVSFYGGTSLANAGNMAEAAAIDRSTATQRALGVVHELAAGVYGIQGNIKLGHTAATDKYWSESNVTYAWEDRDLSIDNYYRFALIGTASQVIEYYFDACIFTVPRPASALLDFDEDANIDECDVTSCTFIGADRGIQTSRVTTADWSFNTYIECGPVTYNGANMVGSTYTGHVVPIIDAQDETSYDNSPTTEGTFSGGTGYAVGDIIWLEDNSKITVDTLTGSAVLEFTVEAGYGGDELAAINTALAQVRTSGSGTGFTLTPDVANFNESESLIYDVAANPDGELDDSTFTMGGAYSNAIEFGTNVDSSLVSITLRGIAFNGYGAIDSRKDSHLRFLATTGTLTVNLIDCTVDGVSPVATGGGKNFSWDDDAGITITVVVQPVDLTITVKDKKTLAVIQNVQTSIHTNDTSFTELMNEDTNVSGIATEQYSGATPQEIVWRCRKSDDLDDPRYKAASGIDTITSDGFALTVLLEENPVLN